MDMKDVDEALLAAVRRGDEQALSTLLSRHAKAIYRFGLKLCGDPEDAKDVLQETLLAAARGMRGFREASSLLTWLYAVARSYCIKKRRRSKFAPRRILSLENDAGAANTPASHASPDEVAAGREIGQALDRAIASLEPGQREVLVLRDIEGLTATEVAEVLGLRVEAVKSRLHRARAGIRAELEPLFPPEEHARSAPAAGGCPDVVALFSRHIEGDIDHELCEEMERHVASCKRCNAACESLKRTLALCRAEQSGSVPAEIQELVRRALRERGAHKETS